MDARWQRRAVAIAVLVVAGAIAWLWLGRTPAVPEPVTAPVPVAEAPAAEPPSDESLAAESAAPSDPAQDEAQPDAEDLHPPLVSEEPDSESFPSIDLEAARKALPDNLYWETAAPTQDPRLLGDRERAQKYWNEQYGKVLSGEGTEEEIKAFYDRRMQLSSDYVRFVDYVLDHQGKELSDSDLKLLGVAKRLHLARLAEVPRRMQEALDRKAKQDAAREAWLAEQRELEAEGAQPPSDAGETPTQNDVP